MQALTEHGKRVLTDLARRYGLAEDTVISMLYAVMNGGGTMAQFNCPELGGSGQWMQGGMTMVGDMFNYNLKATVDSLCSELSGLLSGQQAVFQPAPMQSPQGGPQSGGQQQSQRSGAFWNDQQQGGPQQGGPQSGGYGQASLFVAGNPGYWWPAELGTASSTGSQNGLRYAIFPQTARLAIEVNGHLTVYDTLDHQIGGVGQQQGYGASFTFSSQYGTVQVAQLPVVSVDGVKTQSYLQTGWTDQLGQAGQIDQADQIDQTGQADQIDQIDRTDRIDPAEQTDRSTQCVASGLAQETVVPQPVISPPTALPPEPQAPREAQDSRPPLLVTAATGVANPPAGVFTAGGGMDYDIFAIIEKLAGLRDRGILSEEEFAAKKAELLKRI